MTISRFSFQVAILATIALAYTSPPTYAEEVTAGWEKHAINPQSPFEAGSAFDINNDGVIDVLSGNRWYQGPEFTTSYPVREIQKQGTYYNCFATLPLDINDDGLMDYVTVSYFGRDVGWVKNPGQAGERWVYTEIDQPGPSEAAWMVDLTGDGVPEVLPNTVNVPVFYELEKSGAEPSWKKYQLGTTEAGHGVGSGDINGDGRTDVLTPKGWFEAPEDPSSESWTWHPQWNLGAAGIQILGRDIDGDGLTDIVWGMGHDYGLYWSRQQSIDGKRTFSDRMVIDDELHQAHTLLWADLDGNGQDDELVTGTRVYAHEVEPGDTEAPIIAAYRFNRSTEKWERSLIYRGEPAVNPPPVERRAERDAQKDFPEGTAGTGLQLTALDLDDDGDLDLLCPGKSGLYWFENRLNSE